MATLSEKCCPSFIRSDLSSMVTTIQLDYDPMLYTTEVHDIRPDGMLPAKRGLMKLSVAQLPSGYSFAVSLPTAKPSGKSTAPAPLTRPLSPNEGI